MTLFAQENPNSLTASARQRWKIFPGAAVRRERESDARLSVGLIRPGRGAAETPIETQIVSILAGEGATTYVSLVQRVTDEIYREELRQGGGTLDIGQFGSRLFDRDVARALKSANGVLWEITGETMT